MPIAEQNSSPLLTLLIGARNDGYMGNFAWRLETCLNFLGENLAAIGRLHDVEVLICDWNSPSPVHEILALRTAIASITSYIIVPSGIAVPLQKDSSFPIPIVQNIAIRRARGTFIGQTDSDILYTKDALRHLFEVLDGKSEIDVAPAKSLLVASRRQVPWELASAAPTVEEIALHLNRSSNDVPLEKLIPGFATPSAFAILHRDVWAACRGYDETLVNWGWMEIDLYLRLMQRHPWRDLASLGVVLFHLEHYPNNNRQGTPRKMNPMAITTRFDTAMEDWGHPNLNLETVRAEPRAAIPRRELVTFPKTPEGAFPVILSEANKAALGKCWRNFPSKGKQGQPSPVPNARLCLTLAWLVGKIQPNEFLNLCGGRVDPVVVVATLMPTCALYLVELAATGLHDVLPMQFPLTSAPHKGHAQFIGGEAEDLFSRLDGIVGGQRFDLVFADLVEGSAPVSAVVALVEAGRRLTGRGALLFFAKSPGQFETVRGAFRKEFPRKILVGLGENIGLLAGDELAGQLAH
jgi:hypothetical protein